MALKQSFGWLIEKLNITKDRNAQTDIDVLIASIVTMYGKVLHLEDSIAESTQGEVKKYE